MLTKEVIDQGRILSHDYAFSHHGFLLRNLCELFKNISSQYLRKDILGKMSYLNSLQLMRGCQHLIE